MGTLTLLTVPVGNDGDITKRAMEILVNSRYYFAEDTRVFYSLLKRLDISIDGKIVNSFHDHSVKSKYDKILDLLDEVKDVVLVSDAGSPVISDPAYPLIREVISNGHDLKSCSGVSSVIIALELSGLPSNPFHFYGFFPKDKEKQRKIISNISFNDGSFIIFESPRRVIATLKFLVDALPSANFAVCRELTKNYESIYRFSSENFTTISNQIIQKGEFVIVINCPIKSRGLGSGAKLEKMAVELLDGNCTNKKLSKLLGSILGESPKSIYSRLI